MRVSRTPPPPAPFIYSVRRDDLFCCLFDSLVHVDTNVHTHTNVPVNGATECTGKQNTSKQNKTNQNKTKQNKTTHSLLLVSFEKDKDPAH